MISKFVRWIMVRFLAWAIGRTDDPIAIRHAVKRGFPHRSEDWHNALLREAWQRYYEVETRR